MNSLADNLICVYGIFDKSSPDRIRYVGLTTLGAHSRLSGHWSQAVSTKRKLPILLWMRKRERSQVGIRVLESCLSVADVKAAEIRLIAHYRSLGQADLNVTDGGEAMNGYKHTEEWRAAHSERMSGEGNPMYGNTRSSDFMSWVKSHDTNGVTEAQRAVRRENIKKAHTVEARAKSVKSFQETISTPEHKNRMRKQVLGSKNPMAKLTEDDVRSIRLLRANGGTAKDIAAQFGISVDYVYGIYNRSRWGHVE